MGSSSSNSSYCISYFMRSVGAKKIKDFSLFKSWLEACSQVDIKDSIMLQMVKFAWQKMRLSFAKNR